MVTAAEIRERVERADMARIQARADAAEKVATALTERAVLAAQLADADTRIGAAIGTATDVMTLDELAEFTGQPLREIKSLSGGGSAKPGARRKRGPRRTTRTTAQAASDTE